jgi:hypothetical protein
LLLGTLLLLLRLLQLYLQLLVGGAQVFQFGGGRSQGGRCAYKDSN